MKEDIFVYQPCATGNAFQGIIKKKFKIDMKKVEKVLKKEGYKIELSVNDLVIGKNKYTINVYKSGRITVKNIKNKEKAKEIIKKIYKKIKKD